MLKFTRTLDPKLARGAVGVANGAGELVAECITTDLTAETLKGGTGADPARRDAPGTVVILGGPGGVRVIVGGG